MSFQKNHQIQNTKEREKFSIRGAVEEAELEKIGKYAFDPINLIELPFCTLGRRQTKESRVQISEDGSRYLYSPPPPDFEGKVSPEKVKRETEKYGIPSALAEKVVLAFAKYTKRKNGFQSPKVAVPLREFVEKYMYPSRFVRVEKCADGKLLRAVENEFYRLKHAHMYDSRWWDHLLKKRIPVDTHMFSTISILCEGKGASAKVLEITWGDKVFEGIQAGYTKGLDDERIECLAHGLELRIYRYLDRQLFTKNKQVVPSCQKWAKETLGWVENYKVRKGGRTASNYIFNEVSKVLETLEGMDFKVHLTVEASNPDFTFIFEKVDSLEPREGKSDLASDLVGHFMTVFYETEGRGRIHEKDREFADNWIDSYGFEKAKTMIDLARKAQKKERPENPPRFFRGLEFYENSSLKQYDSTKKKQSAQNDEDLERRVSTAWTMFQREKIREFEDNLSETELTLLKSEAVARARAEQQFLINSENERWKKDAINRTKRLIIKERLGIDREAWEQTFKALEGLNSME